MARRRQAVTIKHVAADAGVSLQTVSRVINNEPNVRPKMQERVQSSIDRLGYVPSIAAQRMSGSKSYLILALNDRERTIEDWRARQGGDWVGQMLLGAMLKSNELGYRLIVELVDTHNDHVERELRAAIAALQPDGVILTPPHSDNPLITGLLRKNDIAFAQIGSSGVEGGIPLIMGDEDAAREATRHLVDLGHQRIGFIAGASDYSLSRWRTDGWLAEMNAAGLPTSGLLAAGDFSYQSGERAAQQLLSASNPPSAIVVSNDQMCMAALRVAIEMGLRVPQDLSLISFDNSPAVGHCDPPLTAVDQPIAQTHSRAVELLVEANRESNLDSKAGSDGAGKRTPVIIRARLVERGSTSAPRSLESSDCE